MSKCHSFGSNYHPSSQSRKISIGITVDSLAKKRSGAKEADEVAVPNQERINLNIENSTEAKDNAEGAKTVATERARSPWINTLPLGQNASTSKTFLCTKRASSRLATGGKQKQNTLKDAQMIHSVQFFSNKTSILQSGDSNQKNFNGITYKRKEQKNGNPEFCQEFAFACAKEVIESDAAVIADKADKTENGRTETLRMKLWQILGTVSSPKSQHSNSQACDVSTSKLKPEDVADQIGDAVVRPRQNSDNIETDSESPNQPTTKRPLTRSLTRKRTSTEAKQNNKKSGPTSIYKKKHQENIFSFEERRYGKLDGAINFGSSILTRKKSHLKSSSIKPRKICFSEKDNADEPQRGSYSSDLPPHAGKTSSRSNTVEKVTGFMPENRGDYVKSKNVVQEKDNHQSPEAEKMKQKNNFNCPALAENRDEQEDCGNPSSNNVVDPSDEIQSPTFAFKTPILSPSFSTPRTVPMEQDVCSPPLEERRFNVGIIPSLKTFQHSKPDWSGSEAETESPDEAEKLIDSQPKKVPPVKENSNEENCLAELSSEDTGDELAELSSEDGDPGSSREGSPIIKGYDSHKEIYSEIATAEKTNFIRSPTKRLHNHGGVRVDFSPPLPSPKGIGESDWFQKPSEHSQQDDLERAVVLFASALDKFRRKMDLATRKKSSEILISVSEGIHLQLQHVDSQIQTDLGKLTSLSKSKRKRLETRFDEQQEQLRFIHEKFKEDIHRHLQDCRSTIEVLEEHQIELKGTMKKQRTSYQKLILQLEEAVEAQLNDAQSRIIAIHKSAREKMLLLKQVIAECLKEGILN